ncbi:hypothetical protein F2A31_01755 [Acinetobacter suaedae]|uniref:Uncharacterized protein n=1 Tax=Acinetobacter suaedae TaxID=2609668 RepID=A0A5P1UTK5_9GAMM|nr:hypothetical protein [Acinetobacter sp. C16S1]QER38496.1 hypothetical protein F2A31_01755 [Acinetobacter sp. C16S1]
MKKQSLTLSMALLGLIGCAHQPVQQAQSLPLNQQVYQAYETLTSKQPYAFSAKMSFDVGMAPSSTQKAKVPLTQPEKLLQQLLTEQKQLKPEQRQWMQEGLEKHDYRSNPNKAKRDQQVGQLVTALLQRYYYTIDGVVDLKRGQMSMTPTLGYQTNNLEAHIKVPLAIDLKQARLYADVSALSPLLTDVHYDNRYVFFDFKEFLRSRDADLQPALQFLKDLVLVNAALTDNEDYKRIALSEDDRKQGGVTRIQSQSYYDEFIAQQLLYFYVNQRYLKKSFSKQESVYGLLDFSPKNLLNDKRNIKKIMKMEGESSQKDVEEQSKAAMRRLNAAIDAYYYEKNPNKVLKNKKNTTGSVKSLEPSIKTMAQGLSLFESYQTDQFVSAQQLRDIVRQQPDAYQKLIQAMGQELQSGGMAKMPYITDLLLDEQGRPLRLMIETRLKGFEKLGISNLSSHLVMNFSDYGVAKVDRTQLRHAVTLAEASNENSMLNLSGILSGKSSSSQNWYKRDRYQRLANAWLTQGLDYRQSYALLYRYAYVLEGKERNKEVDMEELKKAADGLAIESALKHQVLKSQPKQFDAEALKKNPYNDDYVNRYVDGQFLMAYQDYQLQQQFKKMRQQGVPDASIFSRLYLMAETHRLGKSFGQGRNSADTHYLMYVKALGIIATDDMKNQEINAMQLRAFTVEMLDRVNSRSYEKVYALFLE